MMIATGVAAEDRRCNAATEIFSAFGNIALAAKEDADKMSAPAKPRLPGSLHVDCR
ncbi:hypothetical protein LMIY3S_03480 [Labrys miyagiensis]